MRKVSPKILSNVLMEIAKEHNLIDEIYNSSKIIDHLLKESVILRFFFQSKKISKDQKFSTLSEILNKSVHPLLIEAISNFKGTSAVRSFRDFYENISSKYKIEKNIIDVKITLAEKLPESEISKIKLSIDKNLGKKSDLDVSVDDSIIGGIKLRINNTYLDGSVQNKLQVLKHTLLPK